MWKFLSIRNINTKGECVVPAQTWTKPNLHKIEVSIKFLNSILVSHKAKMKDNLWLSKNT
jgi:hypothetical protein